MTPCRYFLLLVCLAITLPAATADTTEPGASLTPHEVVAAQLAGLRENTPDGLARVFAFASPANRAVTGPVARFAAMLREGYPELLGHRRADFGELVVHGDEAAQAVDIIDGSGRGHRYLFMLSRQRGGPCPDCWMTDGVVHAPAEDGLAI
jgi:hypothetical protein